MKRRKLDYFIVLVFDGDELPADCGEGPWKTREDAERFALAEVGLPWLVVRVDAANTSQTLRRVTGRNL